MQTVSELYRTLAASKTTRRETRVLIDCAPVTDDVLRDSDGIAVLDNNEEEINGEAVFPSQRAYTEEDLYEVTISGALFASGTLSFGGCVSREITVRFYPRGATIPRMAAMRPQVRLVGEAGVSEWVSKGVFYIDTREYDRASGVLTLTGYDAMLKAEADFISPGDVGVWPQRMADVVDEISVMLGLEIDARTRLNRDYWMELPTGYTMREILGFVAAAHAGNWVITDEGRLRLVRIDDTADTESLGKNALDMKVATPFDPITHVIVNCNDELYVEAGGGTGRTLEVTCPWGTWEMAQNILASINGYVYQPYTANGAIIDPAAELGDTLTLDGTTGILADQVIHFNSLYSSDIAAPGEDEIDHEYPYTSTSQREVKRRLKDITTSFRVETDRISAEISAVDGRVTRVQADIAGVSTHVEAVEEAAVSAVAVYYALSTSESIAPSSGWSTTAPGWENGKYMWQKTVTTYGDGTTSESSPTCISGARGASQEPGYSTAIVYLYKRSATVVSAIDWQNDLVYHFPTQRLLTVPTGWSETIPAGNNPLYVTAATAYANDGSDVISASEWTSPVLLVKNGEDGADGAGIASVTVTYGVSSVQDVQPSEWSSTMPSAVAGTYLWTRTVTTFEDPQISPVTTYIQTRQGSDGTSGVNGLNSATVYLYHRFDYSAWYGSTLDSTGDEVLDSNGDPISTSEIEAPPSIDWSETLIYNFTTKKLTSVPEGWTDVVPDGYDPIYITAATASSRTNTADIPYTDWSSPILFFRNGRDGIDGAPGQDGADGRPGRDGSNGTSSYIHIKYSAFPNPTDGQMTDQPSEYIGICVTETSADPTTASWYTWSKWEGHDGAQGIPGTNGRDGTSEYVHFAYSTSADGVQNFSVTSFDGAKYLGVCHNDSQTDPTTYASYAWSLIKGADGANGANGYNTATIYLYQRSASVPAKPSTALTYTFSTNTLSGTLGNWSRTIPSGDDPLYVTVATAYSNTNTDSIAANEWSSPVVLAENGADGAAGQAGTNGTNGLNVATAFLYQRLNTVPTVPSGTLTYRFSTGAITGTLGSWTTTIPASNGNPCYVIQATASSRSATDTIASSEWSSPVVLVEDGAQGEQGEPGTPGTPGANGADGLNAATIFLYQRKAGTAPSKPSSALTYTFSTGTLSGTLGSWTRTVPASNGNPCYVIQATAISSSAIVSIPSSGWSTPVVLVENGADGIGVTSIVPEYYLSSSATGQIDGEWTTTCPAWVSGKFIWTRSHVYWEDGTETTTTPVLDNAVNGLGQKYTEVKQTADKIEWLVVGDSATTFTLTERAATLVSDTIDLTGYVTFTSLRTAGSTIINGSNITTGTIDASVVNITHLNASNISSGTMSADKISGGTINGTYVTIKNLDASEIKSGSLSASRISGGTLDCSLITVSNLSANAITSGTLSADRISGGTINADNITVKNLSASSMTKGTLDGSKVTVDNLNASNLKSGTLNASTVPVTNMNASNLTSGSINAQNIPVTNINASNITTGTLSANRISGGTINGNNVTITNLNASNITSGTLSADRIDTNSIKVKTVYGSGAITDVALVYTQNNKLYLGYAPSGSGAVGTFETYMDAYNVYFQYGTHAGFTLYVGASGNTLEPSFAPTGEYSAGYGSIGLANRQFKAVYTKKVYIDGAEINSTILNTIYADGSSSYKITLNSSKAFIPASSTGYYLGNSSYPFERLYLGTNCYLSASSNKLAVNGTVIGAGIEATDVKEIYCASSASNKIALSSAKDFVPSGTGFSLGSSSYPFDELYVGTGSSYYWKLTASALLPSQTVAASGSYFDIGSSTKPVNKVYANEVYIGGSKVEALTNMSGSEVKMGGSTSYYIVASTSRELRPSNSGTTYPFYLGSSSYYWHYAYIGSNTAMIGSSGTSTGSKIGFYGTTAVVRQTLSLTSNNMSYTSVTASNYLYALNNLIGILKNKLGLIA